jgi:hypothetical protein
MNTATNEIDVKDALERLSFPSFFNDEERKQAYYVVMEMGNAVQKIMADNTIAKFPLEEFTRIQPQIV